MRIALERLELANRVQTLLLAGAAMALCPLALAACTQNVPVGAAVTGPSCAGATSDGLVLVQGDVGGQAVRIDQSPAPGALSQFMTGTFDLPINFTINDASVLVTPSVVQIHLTWADLVADGASASATGTITLPDGQPFAQMALCAGSGSTITPTKPGIDFVLAGLTLGPSCTQAVSGELRGCWGFASTP